MQIDNTKFLMMVGPNVIESEEHTMHMASELKKIFEKFPQIQYVFKTSFDKANRTSVNSYRGLGMEEGLRILQRVKDEYNLPVITDVHEPWHCDIVAKVADIIQIPAFLCRQTDLIEAAAKTNKIIHVKKGQYLNAQSMIKVVEKFREFGHTNKIILCERGSMFGYNDLIVDTRNLVWMKSPDNLVSMDITHCLQQPAITHADGAVKAGGLREFIPLMGKIALVAGVDAIFMEVHDNPEEAKCDGPTQWPLDKLEGLLIEFTSLRNFEKTNLGVVEQNANCMNIKFEPEVMRSFKILEKLVNNYDFNSVLDIGSGEQLHANYFRNKNKEVYTCDYNNSVYSEKSLKEPDYIGDFMKIDFNKKFDTIWCSHILEHQLNVNLFLEKIKNLLVSGGILSIVVPIRKPNIVGGHLTLWNLGLFLYNLVIAGFDCSEASCITYDYNIGIIVRKKEIDISKLDLSFDKGDIEKLSKYFPIDVKHGFNGDIEKINW